MKVIEHDWSFVRKVKSDVLSKGGMLSGICSGFPSILMAEGQLFG